MGPPEEFIAEPLEPHTGTFDTTRMATGSPGLPLGFTWRGESFRIAEVLAEWKQSGPGTGGKERYLRKHWYRIRTASGLEMKLYFERQARSGRERTRRWWLFSVTEPAEA